MYEENRASSSVFTSNEEEQWEQPRSISGLSVAALVLGVFSIGALWAPVLWLLPAAGAVLSVAALASLASADGRRIGRWAAAGGLLLSLLFGAWGVSNYFARQQLVSRQAQEFGQHWLTLVLNDRLQEAHQLRMRENERRAPGVSFEEFYTREEVRSEYRAFAQDDLLRKLVEFGATASLRWDGRESFAIDRGGFDGYTEYSAQRYVVAYHGDHGADQLAIRVVLARNRAPGAAEASWRVVEFTTAGSTPRGRAQKNAPELDSVVRA